MNAKLEQWMSARGTRNPALDVFRDHFDPYDPWGSVVEAQFQICYTLVRHAAEVPAAWQFYPGAWVPEMDDNDPEAPGMAREGSLLGWEFDLIMREGGYSNLIHAGTVLERYAAQLKLAGKDY